ncbi:MAG: hypothetical protein HXY24_16415 [Rubrivivax sp.]|nr:hypothetical protein [Rubrivivax sp.]
MSTLALGMIDRLADDLDGLRHVSELATPIGARVRLFSSGRPGVRSGPEAFDEPVDELLEVEAGRLRDCLRALADGGLHGGAMLEAEPYSIANTVARQARLFEFAGADDIGYNWDFVNCWMGGEHPWPEPWRHLAGRLRGIHYKGARAVAGEPWRYASQALPGDDDLSHRAIWATLAASGFDGPITVDPHYGHFAPRDRLVPVPANPEAEICRRTLQTMRALRAEALAAHGES